MTVLDNLGSVLSNSDASNDTSLGDKSSGGGTMGKAKLTHAPSPTLQKLAPPPLWIDEPKVLLQSARFWPVHDEDTLHGTINAVVRTLLTVGVAVSLFRRSFSGVVLAGAISAIFTALARSRSKRRGCTEDDERCVLLDSMSRDTDYTKSDVGSVDATTDEILQRDSNPYGNPLVYDQPPAVRAKKPYPPEPPADDILERKFGFVAEELPMGLYVNPLPDPTLMARPVTFAESSEAHRPITGSTYSLLRRDDESGRHYF